MLRGWARGYRIGVYQFVKSGKWNVGEQQAAEALAASSGSSRATAGPGR
jgi:cob(I)alamin adenosyltransferase